MKPKHLLILSMTIYAISLSQKTYCTNDDCGGYWSGLMCVLVGILGLGKGGAHLAWLANPVLFLAWMTYGKNPKFSFILSGLAGLIAVSFLLAGEIVADEGGHYRQITGYALGYWLWVISMVVIFYGNAWTIRINRIK